MTTATAEPFSFTPEGHVYHLNNEVIPSLSDILRSVTQAKYGNIPDQALVEAARERGVIAHKETERYDRDECDEYESKAVEAWAAFRRSTGFVPTYVEHSTYHPLMKFGTTIDRLGTMPDGSVVLIDIKTGAKAKWHPIQTAGQLLALAAQSICDRETTKRFNVYLVPDGTYKVEPHASDLDISIFTAIYLWEMNKERYL